VLTNALPAIVAGVVACAALPVAADTATFSPLKDNTLYQDDDGLLSNGAGAYFFAGVNGRGETRRGLIAFDLSSLPPGSVVTGASLRLRMSRTTAGPQTVSLHRMLQDWGEGASNAASNEGGGTDAAPGDATWIQAFNGVTDWLDASMLPEPGGHFAPLPSASTLVDQVGFYTWSGPGLVDDLQSWLAAPAQNTGWLVHGFESGLSTAKRFDSRNNNTPARRPGRAGGVRRPPPPGRRARAGAPGRGRATSTSTLTSQAPTSSPSSPPSSPATPPPTSTPPATSPAPTSSPSSPASSPPQPRADNLLANVRHKSTCNEGKHMTHRRPAENSQHQLDDDLQSAQIDDPAAAPDPLFARDSFFFRQKLFSITAERYTVMDESGNKLLFIHRPAHILRNLLALLASIFTFFTVSILFIILAEIVDPGKAKSALFGAVVTIGVLVAVVATVGVALLIAPKRHISFFRDDTLPEPLLFVTQDKKFALLDMPYSVLDAQGRPLAVISKNLLADVIRKKWTVRTDDGEIICFAREDSYLKAFARRWAGGIVRAMLRTNFIFVEPDTERPLGAFNRKFTVADRYTLDMTPDLAHRVDRRVAVAVGVLLDTGERR